MKKFILIPIVAALAACGTTSNTFDKRADAERERQQQYVERSLDKAPEWMTKLPQSNLAVYASATSVSGDFSMADEKAKLIALGKICTSAGGEVDKRSKIYRVDTDKSSSERSEMAIREVCNRVDVTGVQLIDVKRISEGSRYRSYVLVALPLGEANSLKIEKEDRKLQQSTQGNSEKAFKEMDNAAPAVTTTPTEFKLMNVDNDEYKQRRDAALQKPGAVIGQISVR